MLNQRAFVAGLLTVCGLMFTLGDAKAQQQGGIFELGFKPYGSFEGGNIDTVDLMNRALHVRIPVVSYPQRGGVLKMPLYHAYTSLLFQGLDISNGGGCTSACYTYIIPTGNVGSGPLDITMNVQRDYTFPYAVWAISQDGSRHITSGHDNFTRDGTGYQVGPVVNPTRPCPWTDWVADRTGVRRSFGCTGSGTSAQAFGYYEDANGNKITENYANGGLSGWTDTMGRVIPYYAELPSNKTSDLSGCTGPLPTDSAYLWSIPGIGGGMQTSKLCVAIVTANIPCAGRCQTAHEWYPATQAIVLPNGTSWVFQYDSADPNDPNSRGYGDLLKITFPTGGSLSYTWQSSPSTIECSPGPEPVFIRVVASRTLDANDGQGPHTWTYTGGNGAGQTTVQDPLGNETVHAFTLFPNNAGGPSCAEYETVTQRYQGTSTSGTLIQSITTDYTTAEILPPGVLNWYPAGLPIRITTTTLDTGQQRKVEMDYNYPLLDGSYQVSDGNVSAQREYDYGQSSPGPLLRSTVKSYVDSANSNYLNANLLTLLASVTVRDGAGTQKSYSTFNYDGYPLASSGVTMQHDLNPPNGSNRGNQTSSSRWLNTTGGYLTATSKYFDTGTVQTATDPLGHATAYSYSSTFAGAYPTTVTNSLQQATVRGYDFTTGLVTSITDLNNQPTTYQYNDPLSRLTEVDHPDGGKTTGTYNDTASPPNLVESELIRSTLAKTTQTNFDGLGRSVQTLLTSDPSGTTYAVKTYDSLGRLGLAYNPTRCNPPTTNCGESTWGITAYGYDALGRSTSITQPDNSQIRRSYSGNCTTVVDEAGKSRKTCMDGLGRLTRAWEDPGGDNFETDYQYDALDNLLCVHQKGSDATADKACTDPSVPAAWRPRTFAYDSLSRLTSASNPESGTITYAYDADSNVITKKAPSPNQPPTGTATITTTYAYDTLNRLAGKSYNDGYTLNNPTPGVSYAYDGNALTGCNTAPPLLTDSYPVGRRTAMCDGSGATSWAHDKMGRILQGDRSSERGLRK